MPNSGRLRFTPAALLDPVAAAAAVLLAMGSHLGSVLAAPPAPSKADKPAWKKHVITTGGRSLTAIAGDFTGDGKTDVIANVAGKTILFVAPGWKPLAIGGEHDVRAIHSEAFDVDGDGDLDYIAARYKPGLIFWLEQPANAAKDAWRYHLIDDQVDGVHGLLRGDVDGDGRLDLLANSGQPTGPLANSVVWYRAPKTPKNAKAWPRYVIADKDAPGLSHYLGIGDIDGDGRPDVATGAKGGPSDKSGKGNWFAWWKAPADPTQRGWKKQIISARQPGATNIHPADVNGDGKLDFIASRGHGRGVVWFEAPTWRQHTIHAQVHGPHCLVVTDLDADGDIDAATCGKDDGQVLWLENDGRGRFTIRLIGRDQAAYDIRATDLDGDGDLDLLIAGQNSDNVVWYENPQRKGATSP